MTEVFVSTSAFTGRDLATILAEARRIGVTRLELSSGLAPGAPPPLDTALANGDLRYLVHNYFPPEPTSLVINLGSLDRTIRERSLAFCQRAVDVARQLGSPSYTVHAGFCVDPRATELGGPATSHRRVARRVVTEVFYESLEELASHATAAGVDLCVENNVVEPEAVAAGHEPDVLATPEDVAEFIDRGAISGVGLLLDVGHLKVSAHALGFSAGEFFAIARDRIRVLHLSDNDGTRDQNRPFDHEAWFWPHVAACRCITAAVIEVYGAAADGLARLWRDSQAALAAHAPAGTTPGQP